MTPCFRVFKSEKRVPLDYHKITWQEMLSKFVGFVEESEEYYLSIGESMHHRGIDLSWHQYAVLYCHHGIFDVIGDFIPYCRDDVVSLRKGPSFSPFSHKEEVLKAFKLLASGDISVAVIRTRNTLVFVVTDRGDLMLI